MSAVARAFDRAVLRHDGATVCALITQSLRARLASSGKCAAELDLAVGPVRDSPDVQPLITAVKIAGAHATATVRSIAGSAQLPLVRVANGWRVDGPLRYTSRTWLRADYRVDLSTHASAPAVARILARRTSAITGTRADAGVIATDEVRVSVAEPVRLADLAVATTPGAGRLAFYDWEANVLTPDGRPVADELRERGGEAFAVSQGSQTRPPGSAGAGSLPLYAAVKLASARLPPPEPPGPGNGAEFFVFGRAGRAACSRGPRTPAAADAGAGRCLLSGPVKSRPPDLAELPPAVRRTQIETIRVPSGWTVVQARAASPPVPPQYFVVRDRPALSRAELAGAHAGLDEHGRANVDLRFTAAGAAAFERLTAAVARRGIAVSPPGLALNQHIATVLDGKLLSVAYVDFRAHPHGVAGANGTEITGGFTAAAAEQLAGEIGAPPLAARLDLLDTATFTRPSG